MPELLAPAGSLEKLRIAIHYGADAVYLGGPHFSLRAHATISEEELRQCLEYAHARRVKVYVTINIMAHNQDLLDLERYLLFLQEAGADGLIIGDPGIFRAARRLVPDLPIHLSTQANTTNRESAGFWQEQGAKRINLARELSLSEIDEIRQAVSLELEIFVHGALCISYSGRCSLSLYLTGRDANQGNCAHPCRYSYVLEEEKRPGQFFPVEEDQRGTYIFNSKDLCLLHRLPQLIGAGADSLKIEGRMKSVYYVGAIVRLYRAALDYLEVEMARLADTGQDPATCQLPPLFSEELLKIGSRGYTENFIAGAPATSEMLYHGVRVQQDHAPIGIVRQPGERPLIEARNPFRKGALVEYLGHGLEAHTLEIIALTNENGVDLEQANPGNLVYITTAPMGAFWEENALLRKKKWTTD